VAPGYVLRFDLPGLPYQEPSFSSIRPRVKESDPDVIGIAYLLTREEYERLLLSEGGRDGGYLEIDVPVKPLLDLTNEKSTIICKSLGTRVPRENPHPLPSARYLSLIRNGAADHKFPELYQRYLNDLPIYTISTWKTEAGRILFLAIWLPIVLFIFAMMTRKNKLGQVPGWVKRLQTWAFSAMWWMHDSFFSKVFGPGDITPENKDTRNYCSLEKV
jgi:gliotoxin/aspirochlorine biosynthesis gamma-glutamylcyclotransferase